MGNEAKFLPQVTVNEMSHKHIGLITKLIKEKTLPTESFIKQIQYFHKYDYILYLHYVVSEVH